MLSFLLMFPLLCTQAWAIRGGPYDGIQWRGLSAIAGTYGVTMRGMRKDDITQQWSTKTTNKPTNPTDPASPTDYYNPDPSTDDIVSTTAVLYLTVPATGLCSGQILLFNKGLMYFGTATGMIERRAMKITLLSELSHYSVYSGATYTQRTALDLNSGSASVQSTGLGITATPRAILDLMLAGQIDLDISMDYFTGLVNVDGFANYVEVGSNQDTTQNFRRSVLRDLATVVETQTAVGGSLNINNNPVESVVPWPAAGSTIFSAENDKVTAFNGVKLKAVGARQSTDVTPVQGFVAPSAGTSWQIGLPVAGGS
jgi:hypothetical protein